VQHKSTEAEEDGAAAVYQEYYRENRRKRNVRMMED
jgi:hypothetical protein